MVRVPELSILNRKHTSETERLSLPMFQSLPFLPGLLEHSTNKAHFAMTPMNSTGPKQQQSGWFLKCQFAQSALFLADHPVFFIMILHCLIYFLHGSRDPNFLSWISFLPLYNCWFIGNSLALYSSAQDGFFSLSNQLRNIVELIYSYFSILLREKWGTKDRERKKLSRKRLEGKGNKRLDATYR